MNWLRRFMIGRYGADQLSLALIIANLLISILSRIFNSKILSIFSFIISIFILYRILSRNVSKRYEENMKFLNKWNPIKNRIRKKVRRIKDLKYYKYYKCSGCKQKLRVPRGKGKISITCPKCKTITIKKS